MVIWLRDAHSAASESAGVARIGVAGDVIPRQTFGELMSIEQAYAALAEEREEVLAAAREEAEQIVEAGREEAARIVAAAQDEYDSADGRGYNDGCERSLADWMQRLADAANEQSQLQIRMRERLAGIVSSAVEQIVRTERHEALFERALATVDRIVDGATYLRVAVHPDDHQDAQAAFEGLAERWRELGQPIPLSVVSDRQLNPGSCLCESDFGTVDAGLDTQLSAMKNAISRALKRSVEEAQADEAAAGDEALGDEGTPDEQSYADDPAFGEDEQGQSRRRRARLRAARR
jgi:type III secretion protein L